MGMLLKLYHAVEMLCRRFTCGVVLPYVYAFVIASFKPCLDKAKHFNTVMSNKLTASEHLTTTGSSTFLISVYQSYRNMCL